MEEVCWQDLVDNDRNSANWRFCGDFKGWRFRSPSMTLPASMR